MKITLYGASGMIGSRVLNELISRGHNVIAVVRNPLKITRTDVEVRAGEVLDARSVAETAKGAAAVISAYAPPEDATNELVDATRTLLSALEQVRVQRFLMVGGQEILKLLPAFQLWTHRNFHRSGSHMDLPIKRLSRFSGSQTSSGTSMSPAALIQPGERTGKFRLTGNAFVPDQEGQSHISAEDYAVALVDELEHPRHLRQLLGVAY